MQHGHPVTVVDAAEVGRRVHFGPHLGGIQVDDVVAQVPHPLRVFAEPGELPLFSGGDDGTGAFEFAVDAVPCHGLRDPVEVFVAQPFQFGDFVGPPLHPVGVAVGEAGLAEAAVAAGRRPSHGACFQQHDVPVRVAFFGEQRSPQAAVAAADHSQIGGDVSPQLRFRFGNRVARDLGVLPEHRGFGVGECGSGQTCESGHGISLFSSGGSAPRSGAPPGEDDVGDGEQHTHHEDQRAHHVDLRGDADTGGTPDPQREGGEVAADEAGDDEVVH